MNPPQDKNKIKNKTKRIIEIIENLRKDKEAMKELNKWLKAQEMKENEHRR